MAQQERAAVIYKDDFIKSIMNQPNKESELTFLALE